MDGTSGSLRRPQRDPSPSLPGEDAARWAVSQQVGPHPASLPAPCPGRPPAGTTRKELPLLTSRRVCPSGTEGRGRLPAAKPTGRSEHACAQARLPKARTAPRALSPSPPGSPAHYRCRAVPLPQSRLLLEALRCPAGQGPRGEQCPPGWDRIGGEHFFLKAVRVLFLVTFYFRQVILVLLFKNYIFPNFKRN